MEQDFQTSLGSEGKREKMVVVVFCLLDAGTIINSLVARAAEPKIEGTDPGKNGNPGRQGAIAENQRKSAASSR